MENSVTCPEQKGHGPGLFTAVGTRTCSETRIERAHREQRFGPESHVSPRAEWGQWI